MMTTRIMLTRMFEDLLEEERQMKANYRQDKEDLTMRKERLLDRMERLDKEDKDLVDVEGVMVSLAETANKLSELIPDIPVDLLLNKTAEKMAELEPNIIVAEEPEIIKECGIKPRAKHPKDVMEIIVEILTEYDKPLKASEIEEELKNRYSWEWKAFGASLSKWRTDYPNMIQKNGIKYTVNK